MTPKSTCFRTARVRRLWPADCAAAGRCLGPEAFVGPQTLIVGALLLDKRALKP